MIIFAKIFSKLFILLYIFYKIIPFYKFTIYKSILSCIMKPIKNKGVFLYAGIAFFCISI